LPFGVFLTEIMVNNFPKVQVTCYSGIFVSYFLNMLILTLSFYFVSKGILFANERQTVENKTKEKEANTKKLLYQTLLKKDMIICLMTSFIMGVATALFLFFLFLTMKELNASSTVMTSFTIISSISAIFTFYFSEQIIRLIGSTSKTILVCLILQIIRFLIIGMFPNPLYILATQVLHGGLCLLEISIFLEIKRITPIVILTTLYSCFNAVYMGIAFTATNALGGYIYESYGRRNFYLGSACCIGVWFIVLSIYYIVVSLQKQHKIKTRNIEQNKTA